jgi:hypothetical protein
MLKIKIISACDEKIKSLSDLSFQSIEKYCTSQGFDCERYIISAYNRPPAWYKIHAIKKNLEEGYDYVIWIDADAVIYNQNFDLLKLLNSQKTVYIAKDLNNFNTGVLIFKKNTISMQILDFIYSQTEYLHDVWWEQRAFIKTFDLNFLNIQEETEIVPQNILNSYDYYFYGYDHNHVGNFNSQSFIIHYPSLPYEIRFQQIQNIIKTNA